MKRALLGLVLIALDLACHDSSPAQAVPAAAPAAVVPSSPFVAQPGWVVEPPSNAMRLAQFRLPAASGDTKDAELNVISFPGGGTVESNIERWCAQFEQPDGRDSRSVAVQAKETHDGITFYRLDLSGTYTAEMMPGAGDRRNEPNWRMLAAVIERPSGLIFVKCTGPAGTVEHWKASFDAFLAAVRI